VLEKGTAEQKKGGKSGFGFGGGMVGGRIRREWGQTDLLSNRGSN